MTASPLIKTLPSCCRQGLIVGYVGASHIPDFKKDTHAEMLMSGAKSENGKGAEIVISHMSDLLKVVEFFAGEKTAGKSAPFDFPEVCVLVQLKDILRSVKRLLLLEEK